MSARVLRIQDRTSTTPEGIRRINPALPNSGMELDVAAVDPTQWRTLSRPFTDLQRQIFFLLVIERRSPAYISKLMNWSSPSTVYGHCSRMGLSLTQLHSMTSAQFVGKWFQHTLRVSVETEGEVTIEPFADIAHFRQATVMRVEQRIEGRTGQGFNKASLERVWLLSEVRGMPALAIALIMGIHKNKVQELKDVASRRLTDAEKAKLLRLSEVQKVDK